ncbi:unnamed protein product [Linum trigynum]|uniref:Reverse transcriptase zinc-binding domain-containing protein n=1 Tax=Linum trigynum TaxID=586398 RepID=A0AAV2GMI6_9ROSI
MAEFSGYKLGSLPVRYLGLPLLSGKLTIRACAPLIDRVTRRIASWKSKTLSYVGKFQLVMSVLYSLTQFWMSIFILPKAVIRSIEKLCSDFLWGLGDGARKKAVVAWARITYPKKEGGLGLRDMSSWNFACVTRHIWAILLKQGSLWVAWIWEYRIKRGSFWDVTTKPGSWLWLKLLKSRDKLRVWLSDDVEGVYWKGDHLEKFSIKKVWEEVRPKSRLVAWNALIWKGSYIPKNQFLVWLVVSDYIVIGDKIQGWGEAGSYGCVFCPCPLETRSHLFAECGVYRQAFAALFVNFTCQNHGNQWSGERAWASQQFQKRIEAALAGRMIWQALIAAVWRERCKVKYGGKLLDLEGLIRLVKSELIVVLAQLAELVASKVLNAF